MARPFIADIVTGKELKKWYWLKQELVDYCKQKGINYTGGKFEILKRIACALDKGIDKSVKKATSGLPKSKINWAKQSLTLTTIITDSYTNGPNTRMFFKKHCGEKFHFGIAFMMWMKNNTGKTLQDAIKEWERLNKISKKKNYTSVIPQYNQYNQYLRDFFADNPTKTLTEARYFWKLKRALPLSRHKYSRADLKLKEE